MEAVIDTARAAGEAPVIINSDRVMVYAVRFVSCALSLEDGGDRENTLHLMATHQTLVGNGDRGPIAGRVNALVDLAFMRLLQLNDLLFPSSIPSTSPE